MAPIVIITSNSEKHLPDAFLRRCIYFHIPFPESHHELNKIVLAHLENQVRTDSTLLNSSLNFFKLIRNAGLSRNPGIAELIQFLQALLIHGAKPDISLDEQQVLARIALGVLFKNPADLAQGEALLKKL